MSITVSPLNMAAFRSPSSFAPTPLKKAAPNRAPQHLRVLLVEDDDADSYLIRRALGEIPRVVEVRVARDGVEALEMIDNWSTGPDLAIVDLKMPRKDGFTLLRDFAARKSANFPAVVLTSSRAGADVYRAKKRGATDFVTKPNALDKLRAALDEVIAKL